MLTDLHVHLRPDDTAASAADHFTRENVAAYRAAATARGIAELGVSEHIHRFSSALEIWQHPFWQREARDDLAAYCAFVREEAGLRLGIEMDYLPHALAESETVLARHDFDYVIGSVHFLGDRMVDSDGSFGVWRTDGADPDEVWQRYFDALAGAARSRLFDVLAHPDLVKIWGSDDRRPRGDLRRFYEPAVEAIAAAGVAVELSTAGLRKPVGELYPGPELLAALAEAGVPFSLSSDAHEPDHVGYAYDVALDALAAAGVTRLAVFERRRRTLVPL